MSTSSDSEPFNTALRDGLQEAMTDAEENGDLQGVLSSAAQLMRRYPVLWAVGIAAAVFLLIRRSGDS